MTRYWGKTSASIGTATSRCRRATSGRSRQPPLARIAAVNRIVRLEKPCDGSTTSRISTDGAPAMRPDSQPPSRCISAAARLEEHTSELQSLMRISYAVFCLKKQKKTNTKLPQTYNKCNLWITNVPSQDNVLQ